MNPHTFHFLNVKEGDCSVIEHGSGHVSLIDVCNARKKAAILSLLESYLLQDSAEKTAAASGARKNYGQKAHPVNPIIYLQNHGISSIFRFILTHPDMDHLDGIKDLFEEFSPANFYDTDNNVEKDFSNGGPYREEDWLFYHGLREGKPDTNPKRLTLFSGDKGPYRTEDWEGNTPGDAFYVLSPTPQLVAEANRKGDHNDSSYVILYYSNGGKILLCGDAHDKTWEHLLENHKSEISNVDLLIAPHHGRDSDRSFDFLDTVKPKMTFFGNAKSEHLAYDSWRNRGLEYITNNQAGCMVVDCRGSLKVYVTNEAFARDRNPLTFYSDEYKGWYFKEIEEAVRQQEQQNALGGLGNFFLQNLF